MQNKLRQLRWAILGTSLISHTMAQAIVDSDHGVLAAVWSRDLTRANELANKFAVEFAYDSFEKLINNPTIDVIYIGLPTHLHAEYVERCARAGKHILCEKPFAVNEAQAAHALKVVQDANVFCMEALMHRCHPIIKTLHELIQQNKIGAIYAANCVFSDDFIQYANPIAGGSLMDLGCYPVSLLRLLFGEPLKITGSTDFDAKYKIDKESRAEIVFNNHCVANIRVANNEPLNWQFELIGTQGRLNLSNLWNPNAPHQLLIYRTDAEPEIITQNCAKSFYVEQINLVNTCILSHQTQADAPAMTWQDTLNNMRVLDAWRNCSVSEINIHKTGWTSSH